MAYQITIETEDDLVTLQWLSDRGYDAGFLDLADLNSHDETTGKRVFTMPEHHAWIFNDNIEEDPDAFLACCGSDTLADSLIGLHESIV
jgi:hypothetical protein